MKVAIVGGGGVRVPLLVNGLVSRGLPIADIALFDIDRTRLDVIAGLAAARLTRARLTTHDRIAPCLDGADFVVTSIRVGGLAAREHDEAVSLAHGIPAQETIGPAGFAMAVRTPINTKGRRSRRPRRRSQTRTSSQEAQASFLSS